MTVDSNFARRVPLEWDMFQPPALDWDQAPPDADRVFEIEAPWGVAPEKLTSFRLDLSGLGWTEPDAPLYKSTLVGEPFLGRRAMIIQAPGGTFLAIQASRRVEIGQLLDPAEGVVQFIPLPPEEIAYGFPEQGLASFAANLDPATEGNPSLAAVRRKGSSRVRTLDMEDEYEARGAEPGFRLSFAPPGNCFALNTLDTSYDVGTEGGVVLIGPLPDTEAAFTNRGAEPGFRLKLFDVDEAVAAAGAEPGYPLSKTRGFFTKTLGRLHTSEINFD